MIILCDGCRSSIGEPVVKELIKQGHTIINYTRAKVSPSGNAQLKMVHGELDDMSRLITVLQKYKVDAILHLAAQSSPHVGIAVPLETAKVNFMNTVCVLEAARLVGVRRVIMFSSDCGAGNVGANTLVTQDLFPKPRTVYGVTKTACEYLARAYNYTYGMSCITLRIPHIIGEVRVPFEIYTEIMLSAVIGESFIRSEGMDTPFTFCHLDSLTEAIIRALEVPDEKVCDMAIYNVCDYHVNNMKELLDCVKRYVPDFTYEVGPGYQTYDGFEEEAIQGPWICDETKRDLGWEAKYDLDTGVQAFLAKWQEAKENGTLPQAAFIAID